MCFWEHNGLAIKVLAEDRYGSYTRQIRNEHLYFLPGIAFAGIGNVFAARVYRWRALFDNMAASVFPEDIPGTLCMLNSSVSRSVLESLNPGLHFEISGVNRLAVFPVEGAAEIIQQLMSAFELSERARENSVEFAMPDESAWEYAQKWAQRAVDRPLGALIPSYEPERKPAHPVDVISFAVGVALGRFCARGENIADTESHNALAGGVLFLSVAGEIDSLANSACAPLVASWHEHGTVVGEGDDLQAYLRTGFFKHHKAVYENRPIYFPLSSSKRNFVAWVSIHRWTSSTLTTLLADHLAPERRRLEGELEDLRKARSGPDKGSKSGAERRFAEVQKLLAELNEFIANVTECAERGPPPTSPNEPKREVDARYEMDLDDGVMVNSAALWPLLEPQWKDPKKWWKELATAKGRKDYDWAHLAKRYFPSRVEAKCKEDPSLAVAHGCFWRLHPAKAYAWELRLQDEIRPDFTIDEEGSDAARAAFLKDHPAEADAIREKEEDRRTRKRRKAGEAGEDDQLALPLGESEAEDEVDSEEVA